MAPATKQNGNMTPGRRGKRSNENQYFEPGKVGRKTGITLKDTGVRDEYGLEPVSGIFSSSPASAQRYGTTSGSMDIDESSAPDVTTTLGLRKTPRLPPARQLTPRHTNIGSPKRASSARPGAQRDVLSVEEDEPSPRALSQQPTNRVLNFTGAPNKNRRITNAEDDSVNPFKPKKALRRSNGPIRPDAGDISQGAIAIEDDEDIEESIEGIATIDDVPITDSGDAPIMDNDDYYEANEVLPESAEDILEEDQEEDEEEEEVDVEEIAIAPASSSSRGQKRTRASLQNQHADEHVGSAEQIEDDESPRQKKKGRSSDGIEVVVHTADGDETIDPSLLAHGDQYLTDEPILTNEQPVDEEVPEQPIKRKRGRPPKGGKEKRVAQKERNANNAVRGNGSPVRLDGSPSRTFKRGGSVGPISNVNLRATTPFEDAGQNASRYGRNLIKPLKYWENESRIYRNGDIEGIIRAEPVEVIRPSRKNGRKKGKRAARSLEDIEEASDAESVLPSDWEDEQGVLTFPVAGWIPEIGKPDLDEAVEEDIVFAAPAIVTKDVAGSDFKYAKIMTLPFFGAGLVELPPGGFKRAKNSRAMQMAFFVHEGKVTVDVGAQGLEINQFSISKGGVWVVPRGNNYSIANLSTTRTAKLFFAQGCETNTSGTAQ